MRPLGARHYSLKDTLTNPRVLALSLVYFGLVSDNYGLGYWLPTIVKGVATTMALDASTGIAMNSLVGYLVAVPYALAVIGMIWWTRRRHGADRPRPQGRDGGARRRAALRWSGRRAGARLRP